MSFLGANAGRLLRERWPNATALAEELYAMAKARPRQSLLPEEPDQGEEAGAAPGRATPGAVSEVFLDLGGVDRTVGALLGPVPVGGLGQRRRQPPAADPFQRRTMPGEAAAARPRRGWQTAEPFVPPEFPAAEPAARVLPPQIAAQVAGAAAPGGVGAGSAPTPLWTSVPERPGAGLTLEQVLAQLPAARRVAAEGAPPGPVPGFTEPVRPPPAAPAVPAVELPPARPPRARAVEEELLPLPAGRPMLPWERRTQTAVKAKKVAEIESPDIPVPVGHPVWIGVVVSGSGQNYQVDLYPNGMTAAPGMEVTVNIPELDSSETIPAGTVLGCIHDYGNGYYECQVPIWLA
jgi:hypothetical protein